MLLFLFFFFLPLLNLDVLLDFSSIDLFSMLPKLSVSFLSDFLKPALVFLEWPLLCYTNPFFNSIGARARESLELEDELEEEEELEDEDECFSLLAGFCLLSFIVIFRRITVF